MSKLLLLSKIVAWLLGAYAAAYGLILVALMGSDGGVLVLLLLALATTPFLAILTIPKVLGRTAPLRSIAMVVVMACPTLFWGGMFLSELSSPSLHIHRSLSGAIATMGIPALLSCWLCLTFAYTAIPVRGSSSTGE